MDKSKRCVVVLDMGTTNCKMTLYGLCPLRIIHTEKFRTPKRCIDNRIDYAAEELWQNIWDLLGRLSELSAGHIEKIVLASVGEMGVLIDEAGHRIGPMIAWNDSRGADYIKGLSAEQRLAIHKISGLPPHSNYSLAKIKWLEAHYVKQWQPGMCWLNLPNYIAFLLTGKRQMEYTLASRTMALDLQKGCWSHRLTELFAVPYEIFPEIVSGNASEIKLAPEVADSLHMDPEACVLVAGHDHMAGSVAVHLKPGELLNSTGTTEGILCLKSSYPIGKAELQAKLAGGRYIDSAIYTVYGSLQAAGLSFEWFQKTYNCTAEKFNRALSRLFASYTSGRLDPRQKPVLIPHLNGSGSPDKNVEAKGLLYGMDAHTTDMDILFAVTQGVCMELKQLCRYYEGAEQSVIKVIGPAIRNDLWLQLKADVLGREILALDIPEAVSYGALLAAYPSLKDEIPAAAVRRFFPDEKRVAYLDEVWQCYRAFYDAKIHWEHGTMRFQS
ncbi:L-fuculokinase [uncultured Mitsuokella sp.]|uniref:FGGY-family carbohydrate kinase n=1 Tax=uncultured Mitsuokella sp. TaxID=453120 RepID=UPI0026DB8760|nr:FGGY family carbohydrate kinase [uncultured Mitsuokella sp.]